MPGLEESALCRAPASEVWKLLYDATRFPEWWAGLERVEATEQGVERCTEAWPDFAYPTRLSARHEQARVTISCLLSDIRHEWTPSPAPEGRRVDVRVEVPETEAERPESAREDVRASLPRLAAAGRAPGSPGAVAR